MKSSMLAEGQRICVVPRLAGVGGMVSFQHKLVAGLAAREVGVTQDVRDLPYRAVLVIGGTRDLLGLWRARQRGIPVVQRLDGMNWLHRMGKGMPKSGLRHYLRAEYGNRLLALLRKRIATHVVYQSQFVRGWWERVHGSTSASDSVIYNGVDLSVYTPAGPGNPPKEFTRLLLVEGSLMGGYEQGLEAAVGLAQRLAQRGEIELMVVGRVAPAVQERWQARLTQSGESRLRLTWFGLAQREQIPEIDRSAHLLYSADINAACPNAVIEALACGLPVVAFDTGALPELVAGDAGRVAAYGSDPWSLEPPDMDALGQAARQVLADLPRFRAGARSHAEAAFGLDQMAAAYMTVLGLS
jgi:glycosyltransferase involved in cell wall biosynthesis